MFLYNLRLEAPTAIVQAVIGSFMGSRQQQEIVVSRGDQIEMYQTTEKLNSILVQQVFGVIRALLPFRLTGGNKDYLVICSDSGKIVFLEYNAENNKFEQVHMETFGKTGCRRVVPGQFLAGDPRGRAVITAAIEKQKFVYVLNRDSSSQLTISSPLEAHKSHTILYHVVGVDVGFENPVFACLEMEYPDLEAECPEMPEKLLTYYELDLGLNHVVRKWNTPVDIHSNLLIPLAGGADGPSGVLVCSENFITYKHQGATDHRIPIPRRQNPLEDPNRGLYINTAIVHKMKAMFFVLAQSEEGDLYKISVEHEQGQLKCIKIKYFDTVPVATSLCVLKAGYLFVASEMSNHMLYQFVALGDDDDELEWNSLTHGETERVYFKPRDLVNLSLEVEQESLSPMIDAKVMNIMDDETPQIFALCGKGARSSFKILRHGIEIQELAVSELPGYPKAVWTTKAKENDDYHAFIIISFVNATLVLSIGESVEEVTDTGILTDVATLYMQQLGDTALVQIYQQGIRFIKSPELINEWKSPGNRSIVRAVANSRQVIAALSGGELVYFELDQHTEELNEFPERLGLSSNITALGLGAIPAGRLRSRFLAVGCDDNTVRIISLDTDNCLQLLSTQAVQALPTSLCVVEMHDSVTDTDHSTLYLHIGLQNGVMLRTVIDVVTGQLYDTRARYLGTKPVRLNPVTVLNEAGVIALSTKPWLSYTHQSRTHVTPLTYDALESAADFSSKDVAEGIVAVSGKKMRIFMLQITGNAFNKTSIPLKYTPRRFVFHEPSKKFIIIETDRNVLSTFERDYQTQRLLENDEIIDQDVLDLPPTVFGHPRSIEGLWASCIRILDPFTGNTDFMMEFTGNEAAFSLCFATFYNRPEDQFIVVGTAKDLQLAPRRCTEGYLHVYRIVDGGKRLEFFHKTETKDVPYALLSFQGRLLAGVGNSLRLYEIGRKKLLRKSENKSIPNLIVSLQTQGDRILIGDVQDSIHYAVFQPHDNRIFVFADDTCARWVTASTMVDYDTVAGGDKFGNIFVNRLPKDISEEVDEDPTGTKLTFERGYLNGAPHKLVNLSHFFIGDMVTSITRCQLIAGGRDVLLYTTLMGAVGILAPFLSREDVEFFQTLEMQMRTEVPPLCGRDHLAYRSFYIPVKNVVDGTLCELYNDLPGEKKRAIAVDFERSVAEMVKKIEEMRVLVAF